MTHKDQPLQESIEVFVRGFSFTRCVTHPYLVERIETVWVTRDGPRKRGNYRVEEWIAYGVSPTEMDRIARQHTRGRYAICAFHAAGESDEPLRAGFKALQYRLAGTEPLMVHPLKSIPRIDTVATIERVCTQAMADRLAKAARSRQLLPEHLTSDGDVRQYVALIDDQLGGWVKSVVVGDETYCADMYVVPAFRRQGIAKAMMCRMLRDDRANGAKRAVLTASHVGAKLYPVVGYKQIATLFLYTPKK